MRPQVGIRLHPLSGLQNRSGAVEG